MPELFFYQVAQKQQESPVYLARPFDLDPRSRSPPRSPPPPPLPPPPLLTFMLTILGTLQLLEASEEVSPRIPPSGDCDSLWSICMELIMSPWLACTAAFTPSTEERCLTDRGWYRSAMARITLRIPLLLPSRISGWRK